VGQELPISAAPRIGRAADRPRRGSAAGTADGAPVGPCGLRD